MSKIIFCLLILYIAPSIRGETKSPKPTTIKLESCLGSELTICAEVNGHAGLFLFDTGEGVSTIGSGFAKTIGCVPWGRITGFRMTGERLDFQRCDNLQFVTVGETLTAPISGVFDIMSLMPADAPHLDGALGLDILAGRVITFDESSGLLILESANSLKKRTRTSKEIPVRLVRDAEGVALAVDVAVPTPLGVDGNGFWERRNLCYRQAPRQLLSFGPRLQGTSTSQVRHGGRYSGRRESKNTRLDYGWQYRCTVFQKNGSLLSI